MHYTPEYRGELASSDLWRFYPLLPAAPFLMIVFVLVGTAVTVGVVLDHAPEPPTAGPPSPASPSSSDTKATPTGRARFTVVEVWDGGEPAPVCVIPGEHDVFDKGVWSATVTATDPCTVQRDAAARARQPLDRTQATDPSLPPSVPRGHTATGAGRLATRGHTARRLREAASDGYRLGENAATAKLALAAQVRLSTPAENCRGPVQCRAGEHCRRGQQLSTFRPAQHDVQRVANADSFRLAVA
jgi:hypothetical protein